MCATCLLDCGKEESEKKEEAESAKKEKEGTEREGNVKKRLRDTSVEEDHQPTKKRRKMDRPPEKNELNENKKEKLRVQNICVIKCANLGGRNRCRTRPSDVVIRENARLAVTRI